LQYIPMHCFFEVRKDDVGITNANVVTRFITTKCGTARFKNSILNSHPISTAIAISTTVVEVYIE
ncbi:MAG TPA: hypothetical protein VN958_10920, partial [Chitinophagaceae bacterium]|nr:hypothetical protein [Chitinophagaceae bacterium]